MSRKKSIQIINNQIEISEDLLKKEITSKIKHLDLIKERQYIFTDINDIEKEIDLINSQSTNIKLQIEDIEKEHIAKMSESILFLSFGHPEGFGLPVAEAFACGCAVVGYDGLGGKELFNLARHYQLCENVAFGDWVGFIDAIELIISRLKQ